MTRQDWNLLVIETVPRGPKRDVLIDLSMEASATGRVARTQRLADRLGVEGAVMLDELEREGWLKRSATALYLTSP
jgi:Mn-dependent DtxR family transcriptional regulator